MRQDGGDAETGMGLATGFGVVYVDPNLGLDGGRDAQPAGGAPRQPLGGVGLHPLGALRPGPAGRGLPLTMTPSFGMASQGADRL